jgi:hypothetical protein
VWVLAGFTSDGDSVLLMEAEAAMEMETAVAMETETAAR